MSLKDEIVAHIRAHGPMPLATYIDWCNSHYYATRDPFGAKGDFITAPEISQVFGELIGLWVADLWQRAGSPAAFDLVELGPGRGTLMADALRATAKVPGFHEAANVHFVESSPVLRETQRQRVPRATWHESCDSFFQSSSRRPSTSSGSGSIAAPRLESVAIIIANEFFDALPIDQFCNGALRCVSVQDENLRWSHDAGVTTTESASIGIEICTHFSGILANRGGALLIIDYGDDERMGDSLQALKAHMFADPLAQPGEADITAHVDFRPLAEAASEAGCATFGPITQGAFLRALGLDVRTAQLARANPARAEELMLASARLADPDQMGELFKVLCVTSPGFPKPAGFP